MATKNSKYRTDARPFLTSEEVLDLTRAPRRTIDTVAQIGICEPNRFDERRNVLGWTFEQAQTIELIEALRRHGISIDEQRGFSRDARQDKSFEAMISASNDSRRVIKRSLIQRRHQEDLLAVGEQPGFYLRYIPQRWMAAVPCATELPGTNDYVNSRLALTDVSRRVGWCATGIGGTVLSPLFRSEKGLVFCELAAQPFPYPVPGMNPDGGCYRDLGGRCAFGDEEVDCSLCPRCGTRFGEDGEAKYVDCLLPDAKCPAPSITDATAYGVETPWDQFAQLYVDGKADTPEALHEAQYSRSRRLASGRPHWMPQATELPGGMGCFVMPSGFYLCMQAPEGKQEEAAAAIKGVARGMRSKDLAPDQAINRVSKIETQLRESGMWWRLVHGDECQGPITGAAVIGDTDYESWFSVIDDKELGKLKLLTMTGVREQDPHSIICSTINDGHSDSQTIYEFQVLIDESSIPSRTLSKGKKHKAKKRSLTLGFEPGDPNREDHEGKVTLRCRSCGVEMEAFDSSVSMNCPSCGEVRALPTTSNPRGIAMLQQADAELAAGDWDAVSISCQLARRWAPDEAESYWLELLALYQVTWYDRPLEDGGHIHVGNPSPGPVTACGIYKAVIENANKLTRDIYAKQAALVENARLKA